MANPLKFGVFSALKGVRDERAGKAAQQKLLDEAVADKTAMRASRTLEDELRQLQLNKMRGPQPQARLDERLNEQGFYEERDPMTNVWRPTQRRPYAAPERPPQTVAPGTGVRQPDGSYKVEVPVAAKPPDDPYKLSDVGTLRGQFNQEQTVKDAAVVHAAAKRVRTAATDPSAAGDLALIFSFMKMLDPNSSVRETEFANAQNAAGVPDQVRNLWNRAQKGERLNPAQRADFTRQAQSQADATRASLRNVVSRYSEIATRNKINPRDIVFDPFEDGSDEGTVTDADFTRAWQAGARTDADIAAWLKANPAR